MRTLMLSIALTLAIGTFGCNSDNKQQQPSAEEQKRIQDEQQKAAQQQRELTNGMGQTMSEPPPGSAEYKKRHPHKNATHNSANSQNQQPGNQANNPPQQ